jgi:hypothetical protein
MRSNNQSKITEMKAKFLVNQSGKGVEEVIEQLSILNPTRRYQLQCLILDQITQKTYELSSKAEAFWDYVKGDKESWRKHYESIAALNYAFPALSEIINSARKARSTYDEASPENRRAVGTNWGGLRTWSAGPNTEEHETLRPAGHGFENEKKKIKNEKEKRMREESLKL